MQNVPWKLIPQNGKYMKQYGNIQKYTILSLAVMIDLVTQKLTQPLLMTILNGQ